MNLKALIASLVLGSASIAITAPTLASADVRDHRAPVEAPIVRDHRVDPPATSALVADRHDRDGDRDGDRDANHRRGPVWMTLSSADQLVNGRAVVRIPGTQLTTLKLQATAGRTTIRQVTIKFANGRSQVVALNQTIGNGTPALTLDLAGGVRQVKSIVVTGRGNRRASFEILGA